MVLTFLLQTATKLTLKTAVHQEKSEAEESSSDGELLRQHFPPYFSPTRATYEWGKQPSSNTGRELCYSEWRSVIQRVPQHRRNCRTRRFPTSPRISRSILHSYSKVLCHRAQRKKLSFGTKEWASTGPLWVLHPKSWWRAQVSNRTLLGHRSDTPHPNPWLLM